jgi:hypothetical protein
MYKRMHQNALPLDDLEVVEGTTPDEFLKYLKAEQVRLAMAEQNGQGCPEQAEMLRKLNGIASRMRRTSDGELKFMIKKYFAAKDSQEGSDEIRSIGGQNPYMIGPGKKMELPVDPVTSGYGRKGDNLDKYGEIDISC